MDLISVYVRQGLCTATQYRTVGHITE